MDVHLKIFIDRLVDGKVETIDERLAPALMNNADKVVVFADPIYVTGKAYLAEEFLVLNLDIQTSYKVPCKICSEDLTKSFVKLGVYFTQELCEIKGKVYDAAAEVRDTLFLEIPEFHECEGGCAMREEFKKYLKESHDGSTKK